MLALILFCVVLLIVLFPLVALAVVFVKSAAILLPWTMSAAILACVAAVVLGRLLCRRWGTGAVTVFVSSLVLTFTLGYLGYWLSPPKVPPHVPKQGLEALTEFPEPSQTDVENALPIHLLIAGVLSGILAIPLSYLPSVRSTTAAKEAKDFEQTDFGGPGGPEGNE